MRELGPQHRGEKSSDKIYKRWKKMLGGNLLCAAAVMRTESLRGSRGESPKPRHEFVIQGAVQPP